MAGVNADGDHDAQRHPCAEAQLRQDSALIPSWRKASSLDLYNSVGDALVLGAGAFHVVCRSDVDLRSDPTAIRARRGRGLRIVRMILLCLFQRIVQRQQHQINRIAAAEANDLVGDGSDPTLGILCVQRGHGVAEGGGVRLVLR